jgi:DNA-binding HxlR family transcriptional regulator
MTLDAVGDRWSLLVVRELLTGPKRYADLQAALPAMANNLLTTRLKELEAGGIVTREHLPPPAARQVYVLTQDGEQLEPVLEALALWGAGRLSAPRPDQHFSAESPLIVIRALLTRTEPLPDTRPFALSTGSATFLIEPRGRCWQARVARSSVVPDVSMGLPVLAQIAAGNLTWDAAVTAGLLSGAEGAIHTESTFRFCRDALRDRPGC